MTTSVDGGSADNLTMRMRILFISPTLGTGGAERLTVSCAQGLARRGHEVHVGYGFADSQIANLRVAGVEATRLSDERLAPRTLLTWARGVRRLVASFEPDVIYAQSITASLASAIAAPRTPQLVTVHGIREADEPLATLILRACRARVTAVSQAVAEGIRRHSYAPPVAVIPPGVDIDALAARAGDEIPGRPEGAPRFLCVARQAEEKGIDVLLEALPAVLEAFPDAILTLAGMGPALDDNKRLAATLGVDEHVTFMGLAANPAPYFRDADVVVLPSRREGLPVVALEAFALARPVVATSVGGTTEAVIDGQTGWIVRPEDPQQLARAMIEAATDRDESRRRALRGQQLVHERFTSDRMVGRLETLASEVGHRRLLTPTERSRLYYRGARAYQAARLASARARGRSSAWEGVRIFGYHRVADDGDVFAVGVAAFREHMEALLASDATPLRLEAALDLLEHPVEGRYACITFDDGYLDTLANAAPILRELGIAATVFVPTALIDAQLGFHWHRDSPPALSWDDLEALAADGLIDVQAHSRLHLKLTALSDEAAWEEIAGAKADLEQRLPHPVTSFCYPAGFVGTREMEMVLRAGYRAGLTTKAGINPGGEAHERAALRRTMIYWDDERPDFEGKLGGLLDRPSRLQRIVGHSRTRRPLPAL